MREAWSASLPTGPIKHPSPFVIPQGSGAYHDHGAGSRPKSPGASIYILGGFYVGKPSKITPHLFDWRHAKTNLFSAYPYHICSSQRSHSSSSLPGSLPKPKHSHAISTAACSLNKGATATTRCIPQSSDGSGSQCERRRVRPCHPCATPPNRAPLPEKAIPCWGAT